VSHQPPLPAPFVELFAPLPEVKFSGPRSNFHGCFGCGPEHDIGLRVRTFRADGGVLAPIVIPRRFEGPPGAAHGGIVAAYLDEILAGAAVSQTGRLYVTGELTVRYVRGAPIERPLLGRGRAVRGQVHRSRGHDRGLGDARGGREGDRPLPADARRGR
jgi:acyl-coenzyme A thioesterase PaaI-like protein